jgi:hypothetical protein
MIITEYKKPRYFSKKTKTYMVFKRKKRTEKKAKLSPSRKPCLSGIILGT